MVLYPVFVHMYLELVYNGHEAQAIKFMEKFCDDQDIYYQNDLRKLAQVTKKGHMKGNELTETFKWVLWKYNILLIYLYFSDDSL